MPTWNFVLTDNQYRPQGEVLNAYARKVAVPLDKLPTASMRLRLDNPLADLAASTDAHLKAYRDGVLTFMGPIISSEEVADDRTAAISINAVGSGWVLTKRLVGKGRTGIMYRAGLWTRHGIIQNILNLLNAESETGIDLGTMTSESIVDYQAGPFRQFMEVVGELSDSTEGFNWVIRPVENFDNGVVTSQKIGAFDMAPIIGQERSDTIFEWGTGQRTLAGYRIVTSRDTQANKVYHFTSNGPDHPNYPTVSAIDATSITEWKLLEDLAQSDLFDLDTRQKFVQEHVDVRKLPRKTIELTPGIGPNVPNFGVDYTVGDTIHARAKYGSITRFDAMLRVFGVTFDLDDVSGVERASLAVIEE